MAEPFNHGGPAALSVTPGASITECNPEWLQHVGEWERADAVLGGASAVKAMADKFFPLTDWDRRHIDLWNVYIQRGSYVNFTSSTYTAFLGLLFRKDPDIKVPTYFEDRLKNINNRGDDIITFCKKLAGGLIKHGRAGVLIDYIPEQEQRDGEKLHTMPFLSHYDAHSVTQWRPAVVEGEMTVDQVVLKEIYSAPKAIGSTLRTRYRLLELNEQGYYQVRTFEQMPNGNFIAGDPVIPGKKPLRRIPFYFLSPIDLSPDIKRAPIQDLVDLNLDHFRVSADHASALHVVSVPNRVFIGLPDDVANNFNAEGPQNMFLPPDSSVEYLEMKADGISGNERALAAIEAQMNKIGVDLLSDATRGPETAAAARIRQHSQTSVLSSIAGTMSIGLQAILTECLRWDAIDGDCNVELNQDYLDAGADQALLGELNRMERENQISPKTYFWNLKRMELLPPELSFEEFVDERESTPPKLMIGSAAAAEATGRAGPAQRHRPAGAGGAGGRTRKNGGKIEVKRVPE